jgi:hypothetical protein
MFSIFGLSSFTGDYYNRCRLTESPVNSTYWPADPEVTRPCSKGHGSFFCDKGTYCGSPLEYDISLIDDGVLENSAV